MYSLKLEQQAVALDDSLAIAHSVLGEIYAWNGKYDQAVTETQRGIALDPNSASGYGSLADVLERQWKLPEALVAVDKAMRLDPRNPDMYLMAQGYAYTHLGRWEEAILALKRYSASYPDFVWAHVFLVSDYSALGDGEAARAETAEIERIIAVSPNSAIDYSALALALNLQGRPADALVGGAKGTAP